MPFSSDSLPAKRTSARRGLRLRRRGDLDAVRDHARARGAQLARLLGERLGDRDHLPGSAKRCPSQRADMPGESNVGPMQRDHERLSREGGDGPGRKPVRMHELGITRRPSNRPRHRSNEERSCPGPPSEVVGDSTCLGKPERPENGGRDDVDRDTALAQALDRIGDEAPTRIDVVARVGRREDDDLQRRAKTTGAATISIAKTKK